MQSISCKRYLLRACLACALPFAAVFAAWAGEARVPYVPTPQSVVDAMLETARVGSRDYVIDLGSGDGRIVITAARKYGARGFGVDINPERIRESNENARLLGVTDRVAFHQQNLFETDLSLATVITMYLLPRVNLELRPRLLELAPGTRLVSHDFDMGDWKPDTHLVVDAKDKYGDVGGQSDVYFWVVPAKVAGAWRWELPVTGAQPRRYEVRLDQKYQALAGTAIVDGREVKLQGTRLNGADIRFHFTIVGARGAVRHEFAGKVGGDTIHGTASVSGPPMQARLEWTAHRVAENTTTRDAPPAAQARSAR